MTLPQDTTQIAGKSVVSSSTTAVVLLCELVVALGQDPELR
jgi:hypothetical protein